MSKTKTIQALKKQLEKINIKIDLKIVAGQDYKKLSIEHLRIVKALNAIER
jgi:hypothetical protein